MGRSRAVAAALALGLALVGCADSQSASSGIDGRVAALWAERTSYVGDNSRVMALVGQAGFGSGDQYTVELQTERAPYGVTVDLEEPGKPFEDTDFRLQATLLLGLVANLDHVTVTSGADSYSLTAADASKYLGYDVKGLGQDRGALRDLLKAEQD